MAKASYQLARKTLATQWLPLAIAGACCAMTVIVEKELTLTFVVAGMVGMLLLRPKTETAAVAVAAGNGGAESGLKPAGTESGGNNGVNRGLKVAPLVCSCWQWHWRCLICGSSMFLS
ncbi:MAG TPA: hypothetical protein V6D22_14485 [Candidatus Obscuribacterales bacterium]